MSVIRERIELWFKKNNWQMFHTNTENIASTYLMGQHSNYLVSFCWADALTTTPYFFACIVTSPLKIPDEKKNYIAQCLMKLNADGLYSNFILDYNTSEICCRSLTYYDDDSIFTDKLFDAVTFSSLNSTDVIFPLLTKVLYSDISLETALKECYEK